MENKTNKLIVLYTINCPKCKVLELKLKKAEIAFTTVTDLDTIIEVGKVHNISSAPFLQVDDKFYTFTEANDLIMKREI